MNAYVRWRKRQFYWALAGLAAYVSFKGLWGAWFTRTLLAATGLDDAFPDSGSLSMPQWAGLLCGTLMVLSPAIIGFLAYLVSWIGGPGIRFLGARTCGRVWGWPWGSPWRRSA